MKETKKAVLKTDKELKEVNSGIRKLKDKIDQRHAEIEY